MRKINSCNLSDVWYNRYWASKWVNLTCKWMGTWIGGVRPVWKNEKLEIHMQKFFFSCITHNNVTHCTKYVIFICLQVMEWCQEQLKHLYMDTVENAIGCKLWIGGPDPKTCKYGRKKFCFPGEKSKNVYVHRLAFQLSHNLLKLLSEN